MLDFLASSPWNEYAELRMSGRDHCVLAWAKPSQREILAAELSVRGTGEVQCNISEGEGNPQPSSTNLLARETFPPMLTASSGTDANRVPKRMLYGASVSPRRMLMLYTRGEGGLSFGSGKLVCSHPGSP